MAQKIGIPRAMLYYYYFPLWNGFFKELGLEVVVSPLTTKRILDQGIKLAVDDACLPVKLYFGHIYELRDKVDYIFLPRMVSGERKEYMCPKFLGLPDMVRCNVPGLPQILDPTIDLSRDEKNLLKTFVELGKLFTANSFTIRQAFKKGMQELDNFNRINQTGIFPSETIEGMAKGSQCVAPERQGELTIALLGHGYNIYDHYISMNLIEKLNKLGINVVTPDNLNDGLIDKRAGELPKRMFWTLEKKMIGSAFHFMDSNQVDGMIHIASFGCGPDSFSGEIIERHLRRKRSLPLLNLVIDEHTGEAGVITRIEAFVDMIRWRRNAL